MSASAVHHHRSTTKQSHKSFKSRHSTKSSLKTKSKGKVDDLDTFTRKSPHQQMMSKMDRRNKNRQIAQNKHKDFIRETKIFDGRKGAPRIVAVVPLCEDGDAQAAIGQLKEVEGDIPEVGAITTSIERFKQKIQWIVVKRDLFSVLDACKVADFVVLLLSAKQEVDEHGELFLRGIEAQGISNTIPVAQYLETIEPAKRRPDVKKSLLSYISHFFPTLNKIYALESEQESSNIIRTLCTSTPKGIHWRDARSYLLADDVRWSEEEGLVIGGVVRGKGLKADRLVHIPGYGDFQIEKICEHPDSPKCADAMAIDTETSGPKVLDAPTASQDDLADLAPEEAHMSDIDIPDTISEAPTSMTTTSRKGVLLDDHHYFDDEVDEPVTTAPSRPRKLPKGTSSYQAAWILDDDIDSEDSGVEDNDEDMNMTFDYPPIRPEDGEEGFAPPAMTEIGTEFGDDAKSEMFLDPAPEQELQQIAEFRKSRATELAEDREFPDEIELHPNVLARERLSRYRGLKSLRTSPWEAEEDRPFQPADWDRLAKITDYKSAKNKLTREALVGGVPAGTKVQIYIRNGPAELANSSSTPSGKPLTIFSLLRHEHKQAVVNLSITPSSTLTTPIKSKDQLLIQVGPRRLLASPLYSQSNAAGKNNVTKFERFLIPGRTSIATFVGPLLWGGAPATYFQCPTESSPSSSSVWSMVGTGSFLSADQSRIIAKRIVLTGHPYKIHKKLVTVRYMFFNAEDVAWFKALPLFTKRGRSGFIKESLGTHGYFKATFDGRINPQDAVAISLYKRVFPRGSVEFRG
ncbi:DUF663-domain-containing protein [Choiromyces venosus 120613-1]|uniref:DUF663-domain-containing protein n=1 Tax=Choiromyces venosus 120613-1 TaxID=1336337 RepID=A0A3N4J956_9PEZI|nr:DUF663-domain-containing protein [Choiromyces venosus 120613-1]